MPPSLRSFRRMAGLLGTGALYVLGTCGLVDMAVQAADGPSLIRSAFAWMAGNPLP